MRRVDAVACFAGGGCGGRVYAVAPGSGYSMRIAIIQGHPDSRGGHYCHALADAYAAGARAAGHDEPVFLDVGQLDFPLVRSREDLDARPAPEAIRQAQEVLRGAEPVMSC